MDKNQFAEQIKAKYPAYKDIDNTELADKMIEKYPVYKSQIKDTPQNKPSDSIFRNIVGNTVRPFETIQRTASKSTGGASTASDIINIGKKIGSGQFGKEDIMPALGAISPAVNIGRQISGAISGGEKTYKDTYDISSIISGGQQKSENIDFTDPLKGTRKLAGNVLEAGANFIPAGKLLKGGAFLSQPLQFAKTGALTGAMTEIGSELGSDKKEVTTGDVLASGLIGGTVGAGAGAGLGLAGKAIGGTAKGTMDILGKTSNQIREDALVRGLEQTSDRLVSVKNKVDKNTFNAVNSKGQKVKISPIDTFKEYNFVPQISKDGDIIVDNIRDSISGNMAKIDDAIDNVLVDTGKKINLDTYKQRIANAVMADDNLKDAGLVRQTLGQLDNYIEDIRRSYGNDIDLSRINNIRKVANRSWRPETVDVYRKIGDTSRDIIYNSTDDKIVKELLLEQRKLVTAGDFAEALKSKKVAGGRLGNMASTITGNMVGMAIDPTATGVQAIANQAGAGFISRGLQRVRQQKTFQDPIRYGLRRGVEKLGLGDKTFKIPQNKVTKSIGDYLKSPKTSDTNTNAINTSNIDNIIARSKDTNYKPKQLLALPAPKQNTGYGAKSIEVPMRMPEKARDLNFERPSQQIKRFASDEAYNKAKAQAGRKTPQQLLDEQSVDFIKNRWTTYDNILNKDNANLSTYQKVKKYLTPEIYNNLSKYKPTEPITLYRFQRKGSTPDVLSSWTKDYYWAEEMSSMPNMELVEKTFKPEEIFVDLDRIPSEEPLSDIGEVIVKSKNYKMELPKKAGDFLKKSN